MKQQLITVFLSINIVLFSPNCLSMDLSCSQRQLCEHICSGNATLACPRTVCFASGNDRRAAVSNESVSSPTSALRLCVRIEDGSERGRASPSHLEQGSPAANDSEDHVTNSIPETKISIHVCRCNRNDVNQRVEKRAAGGGAKGGASDRQEHSRFEVVVYDDTKPDPWKKITSFFQFLIENHAADQRSLSHVMIVSFALMAPGVASRIY